MWLQQWIGGSEGMWPGSRAGVRLCLSWSECCAEVHLQARGNLWQKSCPGIKQPVPLLAAAKSG